MKYINNARYAIFALVLALSGCASLEQSMVDRVEHLPDMSAYQNKPSVFVDFHLYQGKLGKSAKETSGIRPVLKDLVTNTIKDSNLFSSYTFDESESENVDYKLRLELYNHGNKFLAAMSGYITGFSLGVIPGAATDNFTLKLIVTDSKGNVVNEHINDDAITTWAGIWFITSGSTPGVASSNTIKNQIRDALKQLIESKALKYSLNEYQETLELGLLEPYMLKGPISQ